MDSVETTKYREAIRRSDAIVPMGAQTDKKIGVAYGAFDVPYSIDASNGEVAESVKGDVDIA